jgi:hypothetical protein
MATEGIGMQRSLLSNLLQIIRIINATVPSHIMFTRFTPVIFIYYYASFYMEAAIMPFVRCEPRDFFVSLPDMDI